MERFRFPLVVFSLGVCGACVVPQPATGDGGGPSPGDDGGAASSSSSSGGARQQPDAQSDAPDAAADGPQSIEPNDTFAEATAITVGETIGGRFSGADDTDFFVLTIPSGAQDGILAVDVDKGTTWSAELEVYDATQTGFGVTSADQTTSPFESAFQVTAGAKYFLKLAAAADGTYALTTRFTPVPDAYERNDDFPQARPAPIATPFDVYGFAGHDTNGGKDADFFTLDVAPNATKVEVGLVNGSTPDAAQGYEVELFDPNKSLVAVSGAAEQANIVDTWNLPDTSGGTYYVKVTASANSTARSSLTLTPH